MVSVPAYWPGGRSRPLDGGVYSLAIHRSKARGKPSGQTPMAGPPPGVALLPTGTDKRTYGAQAQGSEGQGQGQGLGQLADAMRPGLGGFSLLQPSSIGRKPLRGLLAGLPSWDQHRQHWGALWRLSRRWAELAGRAAGRGDPGIDTWLRCHAPLHQRRQGHEQRATKSKGTGTGTLHIR